MRNRNYQFLLTLSVFMGAAVVLFFAGCTDNPESADAKQVRNQTATALQTVRSDTESEQLQSVRSQLQSSIVRHQDAGNVAKDTARLASGNLGLARGRRMLIDLNLKSLPLRTSINEFERTLRSAEDLLLEKERIQALLAQGVQEAAELREVLEGTAQDTGLLDQLESARAELDRLQAQKEEAQAQKDRTQAILDEHQQQADELLRQAELADGAERLDLEKQAYSILKDRKQYYIDVQAQEDNIAILDNQIELAQGHVDNLQRSVEEARQRIDSIESSQTRNALQQQLRDVEQSLAVRQEQLASAAETIKTELKAFQEAAHEVCGLFEETAGEFEEVRSRNAAFTAGLQKAESYHQAAQACAAAIRVQTDTAYRLNDLQAMADPAFQGMLSERLSLNPNVEADWSDRVIGLYDKAIEAYASALDAAGGMEPTVKANLLKSQLLAVDSKMRLADALNLPTVAETASARRNELIEQGQEYGVAFTQSETLKLVQEGIAYTPSLPVNLDVLAEQLESRFTAWKRLPVAEQEAAVQANLAEIDQLIARYGEALAQRLEPLRQEMLAAQQRGFEQQSTGSLSDPNNF